MSPTSTSLKLMQSKRRNSVWYRPVSCNRNFSSQEAFVSSPYINETTCVPNDLYMALRPMLAVTQGSVIACSTPFGQRGWCGGKRGREGWERPSQGWGCSPMPGAGLLNPMPQDRSGERQGGSFSHEGSSP
jgi:hypothetical protein